MQGSKGDRDVQNTLFNSAKEGEGGMICENSSETYTLPHVKQMTSASSMHEAGHPKPVLRDNPEGQGGEGGGMGVQEGRTYVYLQPIRVDIWQNPSQYRIVIILQLK